MEINIPHIGYGNRILVRDIAFTVSPGECLLLAGPNGSGKSTLLRQLSEVGIPSKTHAHPRESEVGSAPLLSPCGSRPISPSDTASTVRSDERREGLAHDARCVLIPTGIPKIKGFSVREFIRTGCYRESDWAGRLRKETEQRLEEALELLGMKELADRDISTLSDGEFQKACIAVGLTRQAQVLLLDEPTAFLDVENRLMVLRTLREVASQTQFFNERLNEDPQNIYSVYYPTVARRVVETVSELPASAGWQELVLRPLDPGIVFEKIVVDYGGYQASFLFGTESPAVRAQ